MSENNQFVNLLLSEKELNYLINLTKDRKFKLEIGDLNYSGHFKQIEIKYADNLFNKLKNCIETSKKIKESRG